MKKILIYAEGGHFLGLGNIYRMLEVASSILQKENDAQISFITSSESYVQDIIIQKGFEVLFVPNIKLIDKICTIDFGLLIIDKLGLSENFIKQIRSVKGHSIKIALVGNISSANNHADLVVNAIIGSDFTNKNYYINDTIYLSGPKYLTLRDEFTRNSYIYKNQLNNILLIFGGSDQANFSYRVTVDILKHRNNKYHLTVITGKGYKDISNLNNIIDQYNNVTHLNNINNVYDVIIKNDFMITSPGTSMFEGLYTGIPTIALFQNNSQKEVFRDFFMTTSYDQIDNISEYIENVYLNYNNFKLQLEKYEIGAGKDDIINNLIYLL